MMQRGSSIAPQAGEEDEVQAKLQESKVSSAGSVLNFLGAFSTQGHILFRKHEAAGVINGQLSRLTCM